MAIKKRARKQMTVQEAGRRGGHATLQNQGLKHFKEIGHKGGKRTAKLYRDLLSEFGKRGGRPRRPSLKESVEEGNRKKGGDLRSAPGSPPPHYNKTRARYLDPAQTQ